MAIFKLQLMKVQDVYIEAPNEEAVHDAMKNPDSEGSLYVAWDPLDCFNEQSEKHKPRYDYEVVCPIRSDVPKIHLKVVDRHVYFTDSGVEPDPDLKRN